MEEAGIWIVERVEGNVVTLRTLDGDEVPGYMTWNYLDMRPGQITDEYGDKYRMYLEKLG